MRQVCALYCAYAPGKKKGRAAVQFKAPERGGQTVSDTELLTVNQLAERLHVRPRTVQVWARQGRIPSVKLSAKVVRFDWDAVLTALRDQAKPREATPCRA
jgi:excisionase family DNA binding protein